MCGIDQDGWDLWNVMVSWLGRKVYGTRRRGPLSLVPYTVWPSQLSGCLRKTWWKKLKSVFACSKRILRLGTTRERKSGRQPANPGSSGNVFMDVYVCIHTCTLQCCAWNSRVGFYLRYAMLARVFATATCLSICLSVRTSFCHMLVLCLAERKQDREMYTIW